MIKTYDFAPKWGDINYIDPDRDGKLTRILYIPNSNLPICYWRIENYAEEMVKFKDDCAGFLYLKNTWNP